MNAVEKYMEGAGARRGSISWHDTGKGKNKEDEVVQDASSKGGDTFNARAIRHALRVFIGTGLGMKAYEVAMARLKGGKE